MGESKHLCYYRYMIRNCVQKWVSLAQLLCQKSKRYKRKKIQQVYDKGKLYSWHLSVAPVDFCQQATGQ